jgi:hypothetical protein
MTYIPTLDWQSINDDAVLIDEAGKLDTLVKALTKKLDEAKIVIRSRGLREINGTSFKATVSDAIESSSLDKDKILKELGETFIKKYSKTTTSAGRVTLKPYINLGEILVA